MGSVPSYFSYSKGKNGEHRSANEQTQRRRPTPRNCLPLLGDGEFDVGCADLMVSGSNENECGIFARIFYPISKQDPAKISPNSAFLSWKPESEYVDGLANYREMSPRKMNFFLDWVLGEKRIPVQWQIDIHEDGQKFPIVIFSHGISGNRFFYTTFCSSIASHGFVVAAVEHRDGSSCYTFELEKNENGEATRIPIEMKKLPHGEEEYEHRITQVKKRVDETIGMLRIFEAMDRGLAEEEGLNGQILIGNEFNWSQFKSRLDLGRAISIGHSFGGASALTACALEKKFMSCILLDGWLYPFERKYYEEVSQPVLMLNASKWQWPINVKRLIHLQNQGGGVGKLMFTFSDIVHQTFSDFGLLCPGFIGRYFGLQGDLDPELTGNAILEICIKFLNGPIDSASKLHLAIQKYDNFIVEGTDISKEELEKIDAKLSVMPSVEIGEDEEKRIAEGDVDPKETI